MKKTLLLIVAVLSISFNTAASDIQFLTHSLQDQTYLDESGELRGKKHAGKRAFYVEVVRELMILMNHSKKVQQVPFKRGLLMVQQDINQALFNVTRTPERENTVKWVGPLNREIDYFYEMKNAPTYIASLEDAKKVDSICVLNGSVHESILRRNNFTNFYTNVSYTGCFQMLKYGRVNLTPSASETISEKAQQAGISFDQIQKTPVILLESQGYIAFSKNISDEITQQWQDTLEQMRKSGKYQHLFNQYYLSEGE